jgi:hypothetical protein
MGPGVLGAIALVGLAIVLAIAEMLGRMLRKSERDQQFRGTEADVALGALADPTIQHHRHDHHHDGHHHHDGGQHHHDSASAGHSAHGGHDAGGHGGFDGGHGGFDGAHGGFDAGSH